MTEPNLFAARLRSAAAELAALEPAVREAGPWPLAAVFDTSDEASWGPPEILAHVDEMLPYWLGELARVLEAPPAEPASFGRVAGDDVRIALIGRDRTFPLSELFERAASEADRAARRIDALDAAELERVGRHPTRGDLDIEAFLERFLVGHLEEHVRQIRDLVEESGRLPTA